LHSSILTVEKDRIELEDENELDASGLTAEETAMLEAEELNAMESEPTHPASQIDRKRRMDYEEFERAKELLVSRVRRTDDGMHIEIMTPGQLLCGCECGCIIRFCTLLIPTTISIPIFIPSHRRHSPG
jgi:hypothetical protein